MRPLPVLWSRRRRLERDQFGTRRRNKIRDVPAVTKETDLGPSSCIMVEPLPISGSLPSYVKSTKSSFLPTRPSSMRVVKIQGSSLISRGHI
jgi:hypothetical protein